MLNNRKFRIHREYKYIINIFHNYNRSLEIIILYTNFNYQIEY